MALDTRSATTGSTAFEVVTMPFVPASPGEPGFQPERVLRHLEELAEIGVTGVVIRGLGREVGRLTERIEEFAHTVIGPWQRLSGATESPLATRGGAAGWPPPASL
jgi:hypothetical protein